MRARLLRPVAPAAILALALLPAGAGPAPQPAPQPAGEMLVPAESSPDYVGALQERVALIRQAASRNRVREERRVWPAAGAHTGWWGEARGGRLHEGIDIDGDTGDIVVAAARGTVVHAGPAPAGYSGYGLLVVVDHATSSTVYAHLSRIDVVPGQEVEAGAPVGAMGTTGAVTGSHLHFEVRVGNVAVDPGPFMAEAQPFDPHAQPAPIRKLRLF